MPKWNGGVIGVANNPTISSAKGIWSLSEATKAIRAGLWPPSNAGADPYFENVTMLLPGNGTNGAQNNTFLDSSTNNFTITRNGNTTQGTFTPFSKPDGRWSNYFDGTGDYLTSSGNSNSAVGSGDFCIECFVYYASYPAQYTTLFGTRTSTATSTTAFSIGVENNGSMLAFSDVFIAQTASSVFSLNTWNHVVFSRSGTTARLFLNGVLRATGTNSQNFSTQAFSIGALGNGAETIAGYISNVRLVKGSVPTTYQTSSTTVGTSIFTVPTIPLTDSSQGATSGDVEILTCQSNRFRDNSTNAFAITRNNDVSVQTFSPFPALTAYASGTNGGSGYFDGTGDYLDTASSSTELAMGTSAFTIEAWIYTADTSFMIACSTTTGGCGFGYNIDNGTQGLWVGRAGTGVDATSGVQLAYNAWNHVAVTRDGSNVVKFWVNGTQSGSNTTVTTNYGTSAQAVRIAADSNASLFNLSGYLSSVRITKGAALYTGTFTPSSTPLTTTVSSGTVSFLANFTNGGIVDAAMSNDLETVGGAQISTTQSKFGGSSMYFDGSGDYLIQKDTPNLAFGTGDFTIEMWLYRNASGTQHDIIAFNPTSTNGAYPSLYISSGNTLNFYTQSADRITGGTISTGQWYHIALARSGTSTKLFIDGTQSGSTYTDTNSYLCGTNRPVIGSGGFTVSGTLNAYIDDLRITKGYARYTANFTAPAAPFVTFGD